MKPKKFVIYTHHFTSVTVTPYAERNFFSLLLGSGKLFLRGIWYGLKGLGTIMFKLNFWVGWGLLKAADACIRQSEKQFSQTAYYLKKRKQKWSLPQVRISYAIFILFCLAMVGIFKMANFVAIAEETKNAVIKIALTGDSHLKEAKNSLEEQDMRSAQSNFLKATDSFKSSRQELERLGNVTNAMLSLVPQKRDGEKLLEASEKISKAGTKLIDFYNQMSLLGFSQAGLHSEQGSVPQVFSESEQYINDAQNYLTDAYATMSGINPNVLPEDKRTEFTASLAQLKTLAASVNNFRDIYALLGQLFTGNKNVLVLFENNNELRPTGGFIGTYGLLKLQDGQIVAMDISSIYKIDGQLKESIAPPGPMYAVNNRWFLRDSNWFVHFPQSAKKASVFFEKEGGETPDVVLAVTTNFVTDLLKVTGPVDMPAYGLSLTSENFVEQMQAASAMNPNDPTNEPKKVLADFFPILLQKLSELPSQQKAHLLEILQQNLNGKHIVAYSRHAKIQKAFEQYNWAGVVNNTDRDFLAVNTANLGGTKTDLNITQQIDLTGEIHKDGSITNTLVITRTNVNPKADFSVNDSFMRIFVPEGSELISATGFDYKPLDVVKPQLQKKDPDVQAWEKTAVRDLVGGTILGEEAGKTFFGNWVTIAGGETRVITVVYKLPFKLKNVDRYSLLLQKQPGALSQKFSYTLRFPGRSLQWKNFQTEQLSSGLLTTGAVLDQDMFLGAVFKENE